MRAKDWRGWLLAISALVIALDRWTKLWVQHHIAEGDDITVIRGFFKISHVENSGAAFSMFTNSASPDRTRWLLTAFSILVAVVILVFLLRMGRRFTVTSVALALVLGGAIGNVWDRVQSAVVTDFLEVHLHLGSWSYHWPDFNVADSAIVIGGILLLLDALRSSGSKA